MSDLTLYYSPQSRSIIALRALEELGVPYKIALTDIRKGAQKMPAYLAINPMGKVPALTDGAVKVAETAAILLYLGDRYGQGTLAPKLESPERGDYLRWVVFGASCIEPAISERAGKHTGNPTANGWGSYDQVIDVLTRAVKDRIFLLPSGFTFADLYVASAIAFMMQFGLLTGNDVLARYVATIKQRPAFKRAEEIDARHTAGGDSA